MVLKSIKIVVLDSRSPKVYHPVAILVSLFINQYSLCLNSGNSSWDGKP